MGRGYPIFPPAPLHRCDAADVSMLKNGREGAEPLRGLRYPSISGSRDALAGNSVSEESDVSPHIAVTIYFTDAGHGQWYLASAHVLAPQCQHGDAVGFGWSEAARHEASYLNGEAAKKRLEKMRVS